MFGSFRIARIFGIAIEINLSWLLILAILGWTLSEDLFPSWYDGWSRGAYWAVGVIAALLLFVTVLIHELTHALIARRRGLPVPRITLFIFGGVSEIGEQPRTAGEEFIIAAAGPLASLVIAAVAAGIGVATQDTFEKVAATAYYLAIVNVMLGVFNILPGFPLDGGRVLRSIAWKRTGSFREATRIAGGVGTMFAYFLLLLGVFVLLSGFAIDGLWLLFIGWFLLSAARAETQNLQLESILGRLKARDVMHENFETVTPGMSLQEVVDEHMLARGERAVVVANDGAVKGILTVGDVRHVPRDHWASTPVQQTMTPRERVQTVAADARAIDVLRTISAGRLNQMPVLEEGRMVGMITRRELLDRLQLVESLAPDAPVQEEQGPQAGGGPDVPLPP